MNHFLALALLLATPLAIWKCRWRFTLLLPMLVWSMFSGAATLDQNWYVVYHPLTIAVTLLFQSLAVGESVWLLARQERSRLEAALILGFAAFVAVALVLVLAASNPQPYGNWSPALYFTRTAVHIFLVGVLGSVILYHFGDSGRWTPNAAHASLLFCYLLVNVVSHALKDPTGWASRNALQLTIHLGCVLGWVLLCWKDTHEPVLKPPERAFHG